MGCFGSAPKAESPDLGPDPDLEEFCAAMKETFSPQSIWIGNMIIKEITTYLELSVVNNKDKTDIEVKRIIDMEATMDSKRFSSCKEFRIQPAKRGKNQYFAQLYYEDIDVRSDMSVKLISDSLNPRKVSVAGECIVTKNNVEERGTFSLVRVMAPKSKRNPRTSITNPKLSMLIQKYTKHTESNINDAPIFQREDSMRASERMSCVKTAMTKRWVEYQSSNTDNPTKGMMPDEEFMDTLLMVDSSSRRSSKLDTTYEHSDEEAANSPYVFDTPDYV